MQTLKICKFEINPDKRYTSTQTTEFACILENRNGADLTFSVRSFPANDEVEYITVQKTIVEHNGQVCESARVVTPKGWFTFYANEWISPGRRVSDMPKEEQERVMKVIARDVEFRKQHPECNNHHSYTECNIDCNGEIAMNNLHQDVSAN